MNFAVMRNQIMGKMGKRENNFIFIPELFVLLFADRLYNW